MWRVAPADARLGRIAGRTPPSRVQRLEKPNKRRRLRRIQIISVGRHVAAPLQHLADQLISRQSRRHGIQFGTTLAARAVKRMAVAALFGLENDRALAFERRPAF